MSSFDFDGRVWRMSSPVVDKNGDESLEWNVIPITDVPGDELLRTYEDLVLELSDKEIELYILKEQYLQRESEIVQNTDFKALYNANNQKIRDQHVKETLKDMVEKKVELQFTIDFIRNYIPLLREVLRSKSD